MPTQPPGTRDRLSSSGSGAALRGSVADLRAEGKGVIASAAQKAAVPFVRRRPSADMRASIVVARSNQSGGTPPEAAEHQAGALDARFMLPASPTRPSAFGRRWDSAGVLR